MPLTGRQSELFSTAAAAGSDPAPPLALLVTLDLAAGCFRFDWTRESGRQGYLTYVDGFI